MSNIKKRELDVGVVITTYCRQELLEILLKSLNDMSISAKSIFVVDNENSQETKKIVESHNAKWLPQTVNSGGAGGFAVGVKAAFDAGVEWIWIMDDDVKVFKDALEKMEPWLNRGVKREQRVIQPRRYNYDNTPFYWQYHFLVKLGIPNPIAPSAFNETETYKPMNTSCFEGGFYHRSIVFEIGIPDARFFIYWDDTIYGYLASKLTQPILVRDFVMQRTRQINNLKIGTVRKLNGTSNMTRYYIMRNRGYMTKYFAQYGDYNRILFSIGTIATFVKEIIRIFIDKEYIEGWKAIYRGWKDSRKILKDDTWRPVGPII